MHILWVSDSPFAPTGYGQLTLQIVPLLRELGHQITVLAPTQSGHPLSFNGVKVLSGRLDPFGNDLLAVVAEREKVDCIITCKDPYVYSPQIMAQLPVPWYPLVPVDTEPLSDLNKQSLRFSTRPIAIVPNGQAALVAADFDPFYAPLGVDSTIFKPGDKRAARQTLGLPLDAFVVLVVANNNVPPPTRKGFELIIEAWGKFMEVAPEDSTPILALHTDMTTDRGGIDIETLLDACDVPMSSVQVSDGYQYHKGFPTDRMVTLYQAADWLFGPSLGEGFWLPGLEAQMCGTPVIGVDWTAQRDMVLAGIKIPSDTMGERIWNAYEGGWWFRANVRACEGALDAALSETRSPRVEWSKLAREKSLKYDLRHVVETYWKPMLEEMQAWNQGKMPLPPAV